ncbi:hypothetical protein HD554DRAFT_2203888 [Boletus coccyginus]|nr:hypothetical protein HD554DRAFT_2203888 [Boletus coccyginus]
MPRTTSRAHPDRHVLTPDLIAKRTKRHLDELERTNYAASSLLNEPDSDPEASSNQKSKFRARQTVISDKRTFPTVNAAKKKKSTMNVRTAILYRKGLAALLDESGLASLAPTQPSYLTASAPASAVPPRMLCSVCGYKGAYRCKKCGMSYCDLRCGQVHDETRCERRVV